MISFLSFPAATTDSFFSFFVRGFCDFVPSLFSSSCLPFRSEKQQHERISSLEASKRTEKHLASEERNRRTKNKTTATEQTIEFFLPSFSASLFCPLSLSLPLKPPPLHPHKIGLRRGPHRRPRRRQSRRHRPARTGLAVSPSYLTGNDGLDCGRASRG